MLRRAAILGHRLNDLGQNVDIHMQLFWCSSTIYYSNIVQLALYDVYYRVLHAYLIPITEKSHVMLKEKELRVVVDIRKNYVSYCPRLPHWLLPRFTPLRRVRFLGKEYNVTEMGNHRENTRAIPTSTNNSAIHLPGSSGVSLKKSSPAWLLKTILPYLSLCSCCEGKRIGVRLTRIIV